jgi:hypothetical protein
MPTPRYVRLSLDGHTADALVELARREYRHPREQAEKILVDGLRRACSREYARPPGAAPRPQRREGCLWRLVTARCRWPCAGRRGMPRGAACCARCPATSLVPDKVMPLREQGPVPDPLSRKPKESTT